MRTKIQRVGAQPCRPDSKALRRGGAPGRTVRGGSYDSKRQDCHHPGSRTTPVRLADLLSRVTKRNIRAEFDTGAPAGREAW